MRAGPLLHQRAVGVALLFNVAKTTVRNTPYQRAFRRAPLLLELPDAYCYLGIQKVRNPEYRPTHYLILHRHPDRRQ